MEGGEGPGRKVQEEPLRQGKTVRKQEWDTEAALHTPACGPHALIPEKTPIEPHPKFCPTPAKAWSLPEHRCVQLCRRYRPTSLLMRRSPPARPVVRYQPITGEPSLVSQPPGAQYQNELLRAGEGVAGQLEVESATVGFWLCVRHPLQGRRREA